MNAKTDEIIYRVLIVAPLIILLGVSVFPFLFVLSISFFNVRSYNLTGHWEFAGLQNYLAVISDRENITAIMNTALYILYALGIEVFIGLCIAILLLYVNEKYRLPLVLPFLIPVLLSPMVVAMLWKQVLSYDDGLLNKILSIFGLGPVVWLSPDPILNGNLWIQQSLNLTHGFVSLLLVELWQWSPLFAAVFLVTFSLLRREVIHSAIMDGATSFYIFRDIYFPMAKPLLYGVILLRIMDMLKVYETFWVFFGNSSIFANINIRLVTTGIEIRNYSYCAAFSVVVFLSIFVVLFIGRQLLERAGKLYYAD
jgi:multiple sugar transport system permease protein